MAGRAWPAKGLTGEGYEGHDFWDTEIFALPFFTYTQPDRPRPPALRAGSWTAPAPAPPR